MRAASVLALAFLSAAGTVRAEPAQSPAAAPSEQSDAAKKSEAQRRFQRGIELYKTSDFRAAQVEFTRAYELVPSYKLLYNLGQVTYQRRDYASALRYFRQYLADGVELIPAERRQQVSADIADLEMRVGRLQIDAEDGAEVFVDDVMIGKTPLRTLVTVNGGPRKIDLIGRGGEHQSRQIDVGSGEIMRVPFARLSPAAAAPAPRKEVAVAAPPPRKEVAVVEPLPPRKEVAVVEPLPPRKEAAAAAPPSLAVATPPPANATASWAATASSAATAIDHETTLVAKPEATVVATPSARRSSTPWKAWALTGLLAGGAAVTGSFALSSKHELDDQLSKFPADNSEIDYDRRRTRGFALATDGLLIGTAVMAAVSLYLTVRTPK